jgi:hypothetical protein
MNAYDDIIARCTAIFSQDQRLAGFSAGGSWGKPHFDQFSDLDIVVAVYDADFDAIMSEREQVLPILGELLSWHEHHADKRIFVALYDAPPLLLHVDFKWVRLSDYAQRVENPTVIWERAGELSHIIATTPFHFPFLSLQSIENAIWTWLHYVLSKLGRGEIMEAAVYLAELQLYSIAPLMLHKNGRTPQRCRRVEALPPDDYAALRAAYPNPNFNDCLQSVHAFLAAYTQLRHDLATPDFRPNPKAEAALRRYLADMKSV